MRKYTDEMITKEKLASLPDLPGVYLMKAESGTILYIGKARNLKNRVRSYFGKSGDTRYQVQFLLARVTELDFIVTDTEKEALILENTLIKKHRPRYNINLRDDKTYFSLRMDLRDEFPRITVVRKVVRDGARYFGPYSSGSAARDVLNQIYRIFPLIHYPAETCRRRGRPCLFHQIRQCSAPCHGRISRDAYLTLAEGAALFLEGKRKDVVSVLKMRMSQAAAGENYEEAARLRDLVRSVEITLEKQKMVLPDGDFDVFGHRYAGKNLDVSVIFIRGGSVIGGRNFSTSWELEETEGLIQFITEYYARDVYIPREILIPFRSDDAELLAELLSEKKGKRVAVSAPSRGVKSELVDLCRRNAESAATERERAAGAAEDVLGTLQERLHLPSVPRRIECYDISNIGGEHAVGSRVTFTAGKPDKGGYRHYRIRTVTGSDDFRMMKEVLSRRFADLEADPPPDLIVVDGGIGQLNILSQVIRELQIPNLAAASLAKSRVERDALGEEVKRSDERVFLPRRKNPVILRQNSPPLLLLARIRDEAHRFAVTYHKTLRGKGALRSVLDDVPGLGEKRRKSLLKAFGSVRNIQAASVEEIAATPGIPAGVAVEVKKRLGGDPESSD